MKYSNMGLLPLFTLFPKKMFVFFFRSVRWLLQRGYTGSRAFLDAFRKAVENEEENAHGIGNNNKVFTLR